LEAGGSLFSAFSKKPSANISGFDRFPLRQAGASSATGTTASGVKVRRPMFSISLARGQFGFPGPWLPPSARFGGNGPLPVCRPLCALL